MKTLNFFLLASCVILFPFAANAIDVQFSSGNLSVNWPATESDASAPFTLTLASNPGGIFLSPNISGIYYVDNLPEVVAPFGQIWASSNNAVSITTSYLRSGSDVNSNSVFTQGATEFLSTGILINSAVSGSDNYLGLRFFEQVIDNGDGSFTYVNPHYGWLQFDLNTFTPGGLAVQFLSGQVNDTPDTPSTVPEPSGLALLAAAGAGLAVFFRSRKRRQS